MLHALKGDEAQVSACIAALESHAPEAVESVRQSTAKILAKNDPLFFTVPVIVCKLVLREIFFLFFAELCEQRRLFFLIRFKIHFIILKAVRLKAEIV